MGEFSLVWGQQGCSHSLTSARGGLGRAQVAERLAAAPGSPRPLGPRAAMEALAPLCLLSILTRPRGQGGQGARSAAHTCPLRSLGPCSVCGGL